MIFLNKKNEFPPNRFRPNLILGGGVFASHRFSKKYVKIVQKIAALRAVPPPPQKKTTTTFLDFLGEISLKKHWSSSDSSHNKKITWFVTPKSRNRKFCGKLKSLHSSIFTTKTKAELISEIRYWLTTLYNFSNTRRNPTNKDLETEFKQKHTRGDLVNNRRESDPFWSLQINARCQTVFSLIGILNSDRKHSELIYCEIWNFANALENTNVW